MMISVGIADWYLAKVLVSSRPGARMGVWLLAPLNLLVIPATLGMRMVDGVAFFLWRR